MAISRGKRWPRNRKVKLVGMGRVDLEISLISDHDECLLAAKQEWILIDHRLDNVLQVGAHRFEAEHVSELDGE
jgi:hypothetical protein